MAANTSLGIFNRFNNALTWLVMALAVVMAILTRSWSVFWMFGGLMLGIALVGGSARRVVDTTSGARKADEFTGFHLAVVATFLGLLFLGVLAFAERMLWHHADDYPSFLVAKDFQSYSAHRHRMVKFTCKQRGTPAMQIREVGDRYVVHCGEWFPETFVFSAPKRLFELASRETANDPPDVGFVIEKDD